MATNGSSSSVPDAPAGAESAFLRQAVVTDLDAKVIGTEYVRHLPRCLDRTGIIPGTQAAGYLAGKAGRQRNQPLVVFAEQFRIDARFAVKPSVKDRRTVSSVAPAGHVLA